MSDLETRIVALEERNQRVESAKAWETCLTRKLLIAGITYVVACGLMFWLNADRWPLAALMPVLGYILSTLTLPPVREWWLGKYRRN